MYKDTIINFLHFFKKIAISKGIQHFQSFIFLIYNITFDLFKRYNKIGRGWKCDTVTDRMFKISEYLKDPGEMVIDSDIWTNESVGFIISSYYSVKG